MVSTGIDKPRNTTERVNDNTIDITKQIIDETKVYNSTSPVFALSGEQSSAEGSAAGNYLSKSGDLRLGPMGNEFTIVGIVDDAINVSNATANYVPSLILNPEDGAADDLESIVPGTGVFNNQELFLQNGNDTADITLKDTAGVGVDIITPDGNDLVLTFGVMVKLIFSQLLGGWIVVWISTGGTGGGGNVPNGTAQFQHLEWSGSAWLAQDTLAFGTNSGTTAKLNFPNNVIGLSFRNSLNTGEIELKVTTAGSLDLTRDDDTAMDFTIRSQHLTESDQSLGITVGSGTIADTTTVFGASTGKMAFEVGGAKRLEIDATTTTALTLKSPEGVTAQSNFNVISTHATENDQAISIFVGSGDSADGVLETSAPVLKTSVGGATRLEIDATAGTQITQTSYADTNPSYTFFRNDTTPSATNPLGIIQFSGKRTDNTSAFVYSSIHGEVSDPANLTPDGKLILKVNNNGSPFDAIAMEGSQSLSGTDILTTIGGALTVKPNLTSNALLTLVKNDGDPGDTDILATINFSGEQDTGTNDFIYGSIFVESTDVTAGTLDGTMYFSIITNSSLLPKLTLNTAGAILASGYLQFAEISATPSSPASDKGLLYLKDVSGTTIPFFLDSSGTESNLIGGGDAFLANTQSFTGVNTFTNAVEFDDDITLGSTSADAVTFNADTIGSITPNSDGVDTLGSTAKNFDDVFTETLTLSGSGGNTTGSARTIYANSNDMIFNVPTGDSFRWRLNNTDSARINPLRGSLELNQTAIDTAGYPFVIFRARGIQPANTIGEVNFQSPTTSSTNHSPYALISGVINDPTTSAQDGELIFRVAQNGSLTEMLELISNSGTLQMGFFGATPVSQQSPAANSTAIITALEALGLFV